MDLPYLRPADAPVVRALFQEELALGINFTLHPRDEMFAFLLHEIAPDVGVALAMYFQSGLEISRTILDLIAGHGGLGADGAVLDFGSGFGRVTRFVAAALPPTRIWVSDIQPEAVRFQVDQFGVHGLTATAEPARFACDLQFRYVLASSLFTHLPEDLFRGWLARLGALVEPGGLLAFSVHDMALCPNAGPDDEFRFEEISESVRLPLAEYGSTWVSARCVERVLAELGFTANRVPRGLAHLQDLYVAKRSGSASSPPLEVRASGYVEHSSWAAGNRLRLAGWLTDRNGLGPPRIIVASVNGTDLARCAAFEARADLAAIFGERGVQGYGWQLDLTLPWGSLALRELVLRVSWLDGTTGVLYRASIEGCLLRGTRLDLIATQRLLDASAGRMLAVEQSLQAELSAIRETCARELAKAAAEAAALEQRIAGMRASRFWQARESWFRWKRRWGLTTED